MYLVIVSSKNTAYQQFLQLLQNQVDVILLFIGRSIFSGRHLFSVETSDHSLVSFCKLENLFHLQLEIHN